MNSKFEVVIIGGSNAGLSAAMALGRALRKVLVIDNGRPCNRQTPHSHNFLSRDGVTPEFLSTVAKEQVLAYPTIKWMQDTVNEVKLNESGFSLHTTGGFQIEAKKVLLATGVVDEMLPIFGFAECWGKSVLHCPYCHGYEVRNENLAVLANGEIGFEFVKLIRQWTPNVQLLTNGEPALKEEQLEILKKAGIPIVSTPIQSILHQEGYLQHIQLVDNSLISLKAVFARAPMHQSPLVIQLGLQVSEQGFIAVNAFQESSVPGVFAAGDCTTPMRTISTAVAQGTMAGAAINSFLLEW
ncbi:NAD(P)/FAD-dependent oxidoreductase [Flavihumibacter sp. UBA7668]|uniref:NAD(P)/FAD-dependent oxidoreductase n=1 Tax=Flavihumibacter sp. UBA7668 TaxID=1946542 RepID=UPI0025C287C6|nr:NAD(P)/FAD-dependent oxidoreductase [Flavihumibacter sp. UBA7668]